MLHKVTDMVAQVETLKNSWHHSSTPCSPCCYENFNLWCFVLFLNLPNLLAICISSYFIAYLYFFLLCGPTFFFFYIEISYYLLWQELNLMTFEYFCFSFITHTFKACFLRNIQFLKLITHLVFLVSVCQWYTLGTKF